MNILVRLVVGAITGILTGKALEVEGRLKVVKEGRVGDVISGIVGAVVGEWLFFGSLPAGVMGSASLPPRSWALSRW